MAAEGGLGREEDFLPDVQHSEEEDDDFPPDFRKYMKRKLNFSRLKFFDEDDDDIIGGVFWNQEDDNSSFNSDRSNIPASRKVRLKIRNALHELILLPELVVSLVQFWAPTKTSEGQTLLKSLNEPFALSYYFPHRPRDEMCKYRMEMCEEYPYFYADAKCSEQQLGLPGRVFLHQFTEYNLIVRNYSKEEYPQLELALRCGVESVWALPVFELSGQSCLGVLEVVFFIDAVCEYFEEQKPMSKLYDIFQEFGLLCFDGRKDFNVQLRLKDEVCRDIYEEVVWLCESLREIPRLLSPLMWLSCGSGYLPEDYTYTTHFFALSSSLCLLKRGQFTGGKLPFPNLLYCSDVKQFSISEYPLVPHARECKFSGCFRVCLQRRNNRDQLFVLEFFFLPSNENDENILTTLRLILKTMEEHSKTFKLASGQGFDEELPVEVINFQNGQRTHSVETIPAIRSIPSVELLDDGEVPLQLGDSLQNDEVTTQLDSSHQLSMDPSNEGQDVITLARNNRVVSSSEKGKRKMQDGEHKDPGVVINIPFEDILKCSKMKMKRSAAASELKVSISTLKRVCRSYGIKRWSRRCIEEAQRFQTLSSFVPILDSNMGTNEGSGSVADMETGVQEADMVTFRAKFEDNDKIKFRLSSSSKLAELQQQITKRRAGTYCIKYKDAEDKEDGLTLIACDEDLQGCIQSFRSAGSNDIYLTLVQLKQVS